MKYLSTCITAATLIILVDCVNNEEELTVPYEVNISGNVVRLSSAKLDSVTLILSNPAHHDSTDENGMFNFSFNSFETRNVTVSLKFMRRSFYDTAFEITYGPKQRKIVLTDFKMTLKDTIVYGLP